MENSRFENFLISLMRRTGGWYIVLVAAVSQGFASLGTLLGYQATTLNAEFTSAHLLYSTQFNSIANFLINFSLLVGAYLLTPLVRAQLNFRLNNPNQKAEPLTDGKAWRQLTAFSWRFGLLALGLSLIAHIGIKIPLLYFFEHITFDQVLYSFFGGAVSTLSMVIVLAILVENLLLPAREILTPREFKTQLSDIFGMPLLGKFAGVTLAMISLTVLLLSPIGYHQTVRVLFNPVSSIDVLSDLRTQSLIFSIGALLLGALLTYLLIRSVSQPIAELISTFEKVQSGDLSKRTRVYSTDEVGALAIYFNQMVSRLEELQGNLEREVAERTDQLRITIEVGQLASKIFDPDQLTRDVVGLISDRFGYYYTALFLVDKSGQWAELKEASGSVGKRLKAQRHRLAIDTKSMVGSAIVDREAKIALDVGLEAKRFNNPLLPDTRSEIALPMIVGNRVLGVLDAQSKQESAFDKEDIETLQGMVNQVAIALENARLFTEAQESLQELRSIHRQYVSASWEDKLRDDEISFSSELSVGEIPTDEIKSHLFPIFLREQKIGEITIDAEGDLNAEDKAWVDTIATQAAISLEYARLVEISQQDALRDRLGAEIAERIWSASSVDSILQTAIRELGRSLDTTNASIELSLDNTDV